jgi:hypothetical protein
LCHLIDNKAVTLNDVQHSVNSIQAKSTGSRLTTGLTSTAKTLSVIGRGRGYHGLACGSCGGRNRDCRQNSTASGTGGSVEHQYMKNANLRYYHCVKYGTALLTAILKWLPRGSMLSEWSISLHSLGVKVPGKERLVRQPALPPMLL